MTLSIGQVLNQRYRIVRLLGQGGFGAVYRAWDLNFELPCALKENTEAGPEAQRQFLHEAQILHTLRHPHLPLVKDYFILPGQGQYLVMDYIEGDDLEVLLTRQGGPFSERQVLDWIGQVCEALDYLHTRQPPVIHRDIKPANIKITPEGQAVLVDFGIAKIYDPQSKTTRGAQAVTPGYSPFEQYGAATTDARTDVYALGATAYALLAGQPPVESITRLAGTACIPVRQHNPTVSAETEAAVSRALEVMPENRWQSAREFLQAMAPAPQGASSVKTPPPRARAAVMPIQGFKAAPAAVPASAPAVQRKPGSGTRQGSLWAAGVVGLLVIFSLLGRMALGGAARQARAATRTAQALAAGSRSETLPVPVEPVVPTSTAPLPPTETLPPTDTLPPTGTLPVAVLPSETPALAPTSSDLLRNDFNVYLRYEKDEVLSGFDPVLARLMEAGYKVSMNYGYGVIGATDRILYGNLACLQAIDDIQILIAGLLPLENIGRERFGLGDGAYEANNIVIQIDDPGRFAAFAGAPTPTPAPLIPVAERGEYQVYLRYEKDTVLEGFRSVLARLKAAGYQLTELDDGYGSVGAVDRVLYGSPESLDAIADIQSLVADLLSLDSVARERFDVNDSMYEQKYIVIQIDDPTLFQEVAFKNP